MLPTLVRSVTARPLSPGWFPAVEGAPPAGPGSLRPFAGVARPLMPRALVSRAVPRAIVPRPTRLLTIPRVERPRVAGPWSVRPAAVIERTAIGRSTVWTTTILARAIVPRAIVARPACLWTILGVEGSRAARGRSVKPAVPIERTALRRPALRTTTVLARVPRPEALVPWLLVPRTATVRALPAVEWSCTARPTSIGAAAVIERAPSGWSPLRAIAAASWTILPRAATWWTIAPVERPCTARIRPVLPAAMVERALRGRPSLRTIALVSAAVVWTVVCPVVTPSTSVRTAPVVEPRTLVRFFGTTGHVLRASIRAALRLPALHFLVEPFLPSRGVLRLPLLFEAFTRVAVVAAGAPALGAALAVLAAGASRVLGRVPQRATRKPSHDRRRILPS